MEVERVDGEVVDAELSRDEAQRLTDEAREKARDLWRLLLRLYEGGAHTALGYSSWEKYFIAEFKQGTPGQRIDPKHSYKLLRAARVEVEVSVHVDTEGMTEAQARVLAPLDREERLALARWVEERGGWDRVSAAKLKRERARRRGDVVEFESPDDPDLNITAYDRQLATAMRLALRHLFDALELLRIDRPPRLGHFVLPAALRALPADEAQRLRERLAEERGYLLRLGAALGEIRERLDLAEYILDEREDVTSPPDRRYGVPITVEEVVEEMRRRE